MHYAVSYCRDASTRQEITRIESGPGLQDSGSWCMLRSSFVSNRSLSARLSERLNSGIVGESD